MLLLAAAAYAQDRKVDGVDLAAAGAMARTDTLLCVQAPSRIVVRCPAAGVLGLIQPGDLPAGFAAGNNPRIAAVGNQVPGVGSMVIELLHENGTYALKDEAGIWGSANVRAYMGVSRTFGPGEGAANGPAAALFGFANNNGSAADVVAVLGDSVARVSGGTVFGGNLIARTGAGVNAKLVGLEIDVEPAPGTLATAGSGGLFLNAYSSAIPALPS